MKFKRFCMVSLSLILTAALSISCVFASTYEVDPDTELDLTVPIYYTDNYYPGMFSSGVSTWATAAYGSYSASGWNPLVSVESVSGSSVFYYPANVTPTVSVGAGSVSGSYVANSAEAQTAATLFLTGINNTYFDFQSSGFVFSQESAQADTFYLNGTLRFMFGSFWNVVTDQNYQFYAALNPVGVQFLVDGKPYGDIMDISSYTSAFTSAFTGSPATATVTFDNVKIYGVESAPELIGFRVYVDTDYSGGSKAFGQASSSVYSISNSFNWTAQPEITFQKESTESDADLGALVEYFKNGLFNSNNVPFLDVVVSFLQDGLFDSNGSSLLARIFNESLRLPAGLSFLNASGGIGETYYNFNLYDIFRGGFLGLRTLMVDSVGRSYLKLQYELLVSSLYQYNSNGLKYLSLSGVESTSTSYLYLVNLVRQGFLGLSQNIKDFNSYLEDSTFSWQNYNLETHELDSAQTLTGQNALFGTAFQSIEENLGRLTYVFANDDEIELRDQADPSVNQFKDSFGGGASAGDILEIADSVGEVQGMFDTGFGVNDLWDSLNGESWWSWFTTENAQALDSTGAPAAIGDEDPFNTQTYYDHLQAVEEIRSREEE